MLKRGDVMLINHENIQRRFSENLVWATGIDLATAWANSNGGLRELEALKDRTAPLEVRSVVGLWGTTTTSGALGLADMGELRVADASRRFHPKVYVFRSESRSVAWIGSANFTSGGFGMNEEALFETPDTETVENWFDRLWKQCGPLGECAINNYAESRKENRPRLASRLPVTVDSTPMQLLEKSITGEAMSKPWSNAIGGGASVIDGRSWVCSIAGTTPFRICMTS